MKADNPYQRFIVMVQEKCTYGEADIIIKEKCSLSEARIRIEQRRNLEACIPVMNKYSL